jgi:hypothetical protein
MMPKLVPAVPPLHSPTRRWYRDNTTPALLRM